MISIPKYCLRFAQRNNKKEDTEILFPDAAYQHQLIFELNSIIMKSDIPDEAENVIKCNKMYEAGNMSEAYDKMRNLYEAYGRIIKKCVDRFYRLKIRKMTEKEYYGFIIYRDKNNCLLCTEDLYFELKRQALNITNSFYIVDSFFELCSKGDIDVTDIELKDTFIYINNAMYWLFKEAIILGRLDINI